jgi:hypothetical protein
MPKGCDLKAGKPWNLPVDAAAEHADPRGELSLAI